ncbi:CotH kinase family protein [Flavihumibacter petaseus]|uniref:CotH kinase family protein n=1 Tax=Flavihumibacter petaseus TaxID=549295 RepID=UPI00061D2D59|nr:CotH kinase family protein [Flavihumibacter petaseus]
MRRISLLTVLFYLFTFSAFSQPGDFHDSDLPIIVISTNGQEIPDDPKIMADMGIIYNGKGQRNSLADPFNEYQGKIAIEIRGQSSQMFPMKSYSVDLKKATGGSLDASLLGMPAESDWVLYAPYTDKTLLRNVLAYTIAASLGQWAPRCRFVELVLNDDYRGVYVLMEKIKRNSNRVAITKIASGDASGDAVTGGYIFSLDKEPDGWWSDFCGRQFSYVYPKVEDIAGMQASYLKKFVDSFEASLQAPYFQDPERGVRHYADLNTFMDYFYVNEISRNVDGYRLSSFFHKDRNTTDGRIKAGPVWDYDLAFRNADYCDGSADTGWAFRFNRVCPADPAGLVPFWWDRLFKDTAYVAALRCRWKQVRSGVVSEAKLTQVIDSIAALVNEAQQRHFARWPVLGQYVWPNPQPIPATYAGEIAQLKTWLVSRLHWIDQNLPNTGNCMDWPEKQPGTFLLKAYPNPFTGDLPVRILSRGQQSVDLLIYDMSGRRMYHTTVPAQQGMNQVLLPSAAWAPGVYLVRAANGEGEKQVLRLIKR